MTLEWKSLEKDPRFETCESWKCWPGAVLLDDEIRYYAECSSYKLIDPFNEANLKPARYQLTLGPEARIGGETVKIETDKPLVIAPHQVAIVRTRETLNLPRFLIARWNLRIDMVYKGLLWVGALQVDPGWVGYLPCPLYNLSDDTVEIKLGEKLFTIDFVRTTQYHVGKNLEYPGKVPPPALNPPIHVYDENNLRSGPYEAIEQVNQVKNDAADVRTRVDQLGDRMGAAISIMIVVLGVIVTALALLVAAQTFMLTLSIPIAGATILSIIALGMSLYMLFRAPRACSCGHAGCNDG